MCGRRPRAPAVCECWIHTAVLNKQLAQKNSQNTRTPEQSEHQNSQNSRTVRTPLATESYIAWQGRQPEPGALFSYAGSRHTAVRRRRVHIAQVSCWKDENNISANIIFNIVNPQLQLTISLWFLFTFPYNTLANCGSGTGLAISK